MRYALAILLALAAAGCDDDPVTPVGVARDVVPPAAPRGLYSTTGDGRVTLRWLANTEYDVAGYKVYWSTCSSGPGCPYDLVGTTSSNSFQVTNLPNGVTYYYAVAAFDATGNESDLTYEDVFDTPRPEGTGLVLTSWNVDSLRAGYDFSAYAVAPYNAPNVDIFFSRQGALSEMIAPFTDTDIQDAGYATTLDAVDYAPDGGWSPTGTVELIPGHCYVVWTHDNHFAKFRVTRLTASAVEVDWAYQVAEGNPELKAKRSTTGTRSVRTNLRTLPGI